jgi:Ca2+-binding RTX toxin-like protein
MATRKGTRGIDSLNGTSLADLILGYLGNDTLKGLGGLDRIFGGGGNDRIDGGTGNDRLFGGKGKDTIVGGTGNDFIDHSSGLTTGALDDGATDKINAGAGNDAVSMGRGDSALGGSGIDSANISFGIINGGALFNLSFANAHKSAAGAIGFGATKVGQFEAVTFFSSSAKAGSKIIGSIGDDNLGMSLDFQTTGTQGVSISGGRGSDNINGSQKNDTLKGDSGDDTLRGDDGNDRLTGGTGADIFVFRLETPSEFQQPSGVDTISDFSIRDDVLAFSSFSLNFGDESNLLRKGVGLTNGNTAVGIAQFLYDTSNGALSVDTNGSRAGGVVEVAILSNKANITAKDISVDFEILVV